MIAADLAAKNALQRTFFQPRSETGPNPPAAERSSHVAIPPTAGNQRTHQQGRVGREVASPLTLERDSFHGSLHEAVAGILAAVDQVILQLYGSGAVTQACHHTDPAHEVAEAKSRVVQHRPHSGGGSRQFKISGQHTDDGHGMAIEFDAPAKNVLAAAEVNLPEIVAQDCAVSARESLRWLRQPTQLSLGPEQLEKLRSHARLNDGNLAPVVRQPAWAPGI